MSLQHSFSRRQFLRLAGAGATAGVLAACATPTATPAPSGETQATPAPAGPVTISYWHIWGGVRTEQLQGVLNTFQEENSDITVEPLLLPNPGYADKIITGLAGDAPDLTMIYTDEFAPSARLGALRQMDDLLAGDGLASDIWYPGIWNMTQWEGRTYGIPFVGNFLFFLYWNRDHYAAAGLDAENAPATWDELRNMARTLTRVDANGNVENLGYVPGGSGEWMQSAYRNGSAWYGDGSPDNVAVGGPEALEALQHVVDLYNDMGGWDAVGAVTESWGNQQLGNPMVAEVASTITSGVFTVNIINQQNPDLNYKMGPLPHGPKGQATDVIQACWNNAIPTRARHPEAAWQLAKYLSVGQGHLDFMVNIQGRPAMVREYNGAPYDATVRETNPYWDVVLEVLNGPQASFPVSNRLAAANAIMTEAFESVMLGQRSVAEGAAWAQEQVTAAFAEA